MSELGNGVVISSVTGYLDLTNEQLDNIICKDPISDHYDVEDAPFAR